MSLLRGFSAGASCVLFLALASGVSQGADEEVPSGSPKELLTYIQKLQAAQPKGSSTDERRDDLRRIQAKIVAAAEKIRAAKADDASLQAAIEAEFEALSVQRGLGDADAAEKLDALVRELKDDKRPDIAQTAEFFQLLKEKEGLDESDEKDLQAFARKAEKFLLRARLRPKMIGLAALSVQILQQVEGALPAAKVAGEFAVAFAKSDDPLVASNAAQFCVYAGRLYEAEKKPDEAAANYERVAGLLAKSDDEDVKASAEGLLGALRYLKLLGSSLKIEGTLVDGKKFDWSKYKGKVVLVDFWATWCSPCLKELPNVKETYEKYHDRGFDVVGISLDDDEQTLKEFLKEEKLPWPILFSRDPQATGWEHPMASHYGISSIPATILVGRDGKVVSLSARGEDLGELVAELTGAEEDGKKPAPKKKSKGDKAGKE